MGEWRRALDRREWRRRALDRREWMRALDGGSGGGEH